MVTNLVQLRTEGRIRLGISKFLEQRVLASSLGVLRQPSEILAGDGIDNVQILL